jgi:uncharacterized repeat protein (TIGR03803 family)
MSVLESASEGSEFGGNMRYWKTVCLGCALFAVTAIASPAQTFTTLVSFDGDATGSQPIAPLVQGLDGNFYGTTYTGGTQDYGTVFKVTPSGKLTVLHSFCSLKNCADGESPWGGLVLASNGNFYGTASGGGAGSIYCLAGCGTVFEITPAGRLTTVYSFCAEAKCADGNYPEAGLVQGADGSFYGTTYGLGPNEWGTVFKLTPSGKLTTLHSFCSEANCADGSYPKSALMQATDGNLRGTTGGGGLSDVCPPGCGTVFEITPEGKLTTLYEFCSEANCSDGDGPIGGLVQATNGSSYGTTGSGGSPSVCETGCGTVFEISPTGKLNTLYSFCSQTNCTDGYRPVGLVQATNGNFYGVTAYGGTSAVCTTGGYGGCGTVFEISPAGNLTTLYSFCPQASCADGAFPLAGLLQTTNGDFYGTTPIGGANNGGTVFSLSVGLNPFVETLPASGKVGGKVIILGNHLTGATTVSFHGTAAVFAVVSDTEITAEVPTGATTGRVTVETTSGTLKSNKQFQIAP